MFDSIFEAIEEWMRELLTGMINSNLSTMFADVNELLTKLMDQAVAMVGVDVEKMTKEEKESVLRYLDEKGAFLITKSSDRVCEFLGISKFKLYNYLNSIRGDKESQRKREPEE